MYSRQQLEDFMNNKPYGAFKREMKRNKGTKEYKFKITPYKNLYDDPQEIIVRGKSQASAFEEAKRVARNTIDYKPDGWLYQLIR